MAVRTRRGAAVVVVSPRGGWSCLRLGIFSLLLLHYGSCQASWMYLGVASLAGSVQQQDDVCNKVPGLVQEQLQVCRENPESVFCISQGARQGISECQTQFRDERWNCSTNTNHSVFGPLLDKATKETAFIYAVLSAGVVHAVTRACSEGNLTDCSCDMSRHGQQHPDGWKWGGCSDNVNYGLWFSKTFVDAADAANVRRRNRRSRRRKRRREESQKIEVDVIEGGASGADDDGGDGGGDITSAATTTSGEAPASKKDDSVSATRGSGSGGDASSGSSSSRRKGRKRKNKKKKRQKGGKARSLMNLHNNEVGRKAVERLMSRKCRCHGISGSCAVMTCWFALPPFRDIGHLLKMSYNRGVQLAQRSKGKLRAKDKKRRERPIPIEQTDLVYLRRSPSFCRARPGKGILGTKGRQCNRTSDENDGCEFLCCGRGYNTQVKRVDKKCHCKFHWCCTIECKICTHMEDVHTCK